MMIFAKDMKNKLNKKHRYMKHKLIALLITGACAAVAEATAQPVTKITFYSPSVVRIVKYPADMKTQPEKHSFTVIMKPEKVKVKTTDTGNATEYETEDMRVKVDKATGTALFLTIKGDTLLREMGEPQFTMRKGDADEGKYIVEQSWKLDKGEAIFGLGQRKDKDISLRGKDITLWNVNTYTTIPVFTSQKGYGVFWDNMGRSFFTDNDKGTTFKSEVAEMTDYYFVYRDGTTDGVIAGLRALTGRATMFPLWAMGHWQCRERYKTSDELAGVLDKYRELEIPLDGIVQDWQYWGCDSNWNAMRFMNPYYINKVGDPAYERYLPADMRNMKQSEPRLKSPEEMVKYVHSRNSHLMISIWASFGPWTEPYAELKKIGALLPFETWPRNSGTLPYDAFNPKARDIYWKHLSNLYKMGFDAWWTDSSEPDHFEKPGDDDYMTAAGSWRSVKNAFALVHNRGIYEHQRSTKGNSKRSIQMTRSGQLGIQHYGTFSWSGDISSTWDVMQEQVPTGLSYVICGIPFWNTDIGGFFSWSYHNNPKDPGMQELQTRWMQWGAFMPLMRNHCSSPMVSEIYEYGKPGDWAYDVQKAYVKLRYRMLPYIYSTQGDVVLNDGSMMRPLVMDFAADSTALTRNDEYMFGRSMLVKPITSPLYTWQDNNGYGHLIYPDIRRAAAPVEVYLPAGTAWYDFWTNERIDGGRKLMRPCPITEMPVYVRAGSIMPWGPEVQYSSEKPWDDLEIRVYPGADGKFVLYEDRGDGYEYERGQYTLTEFRWDDATRTLTIGARKGKYPKMLTHRRFNIVMVGKDSGRGDGAMKVTRTVEYDGKEITMKF